MADRLDLYFRAHTTPADAQTENWKTGDANSPKQALIFHCATTNDERQDLLFGAYISAHLKDGQFIAEEIGLFYRDGHPGGVAGVEALCQGQRF